MKIAHLISSYLPRVGGAQICVHNIALRHSQAGQQVQVIAPAEYGNFSSDSYIVSGLWRGTIFLLKNQFEWGQRYLCFQVDELQKRHQFDVWQVTIGYPFGAAVVDHFNRKGIPCVLRCSGEDIQVHEETAYGVRRNRDVDQRVRSQYVKFDRTVAISPTMRDSYLELNIPQERIVMIPNGVDARRFSFGSNVEQTRKRLGVPSERKLILTVGRNHPKKGFDQIPEIIRGLKALRDDFLWLIVGEGSEDILKQAKHCGVDRYLITKDNVCLGSVAAEYPSQELIAIYQAADVFVFPTLIETFGIVVIEAMAAGLAVVTTHALGVKDLLDDGVQGFKVEPNDCQQMAERVHRLLSDKSLHQQCSINAVRKSREYDWDQIAQRYFTLYENLIREKRAS